MRTNLLLAAFFACSLTGGAALAEKPGEQQRSHGDVVDKSYRSQVVRAPAERMREVTRPETRVKEPSSKAETRWNCSADGGECRSHRPTTERTTTSQQKTREALKGSVKQQKPNEKAAQRWNCSAETESCSAPRGSGTGGASQSKAADQARQGDKSYADKQRDARTSAQTRSEPAKKNGPTLTIAQRAQAEKMVAFLKAKICEKMGGECASGGE